MKRILSISIILIAALAAVAQDKPFGISFTGFVKTDFFYDSRQTVNVREGHFLLYPQNELLDANGVDINAAPGFNILSIQTRLTGNITGPDAFGAKTSGILEADFFGNEAATFIDVNGFRLRHALVKLNWEKAELLMGQFWHPMFVHDAFPAVISFNTGAPFQPFSRNPQLRFGYNIGKFKVFAAALAQRDFATNGPAGVSSVYLRNSSIPELHLQLQFRNKQESGNELLAGFGGGYKVITPRIQNTKNMSVDESIEGFSGLAYVKYACKPLTAKIQATYGQNLHDLTMLGGYAIQYFNDTSLISKDIREYTNLDNLAVWFEIHTNGKRIQPGLFAGFSKNMGSVKNIHDWNTTTSYFARGFNIDYAYRVSPRVSFISGKTRIALELEYTTAAYGATRNSLGVVQTSKEISNIRALLSAIYTF